MKGTVVALDRINGQAAAARVVDGMLDDLLIDPRPDGPPVPGTVFLARCDRPVKGHGGMFVDLGVGGSGFLRNVSGLSAGQMIRVQVSGYAEPGKAVPVTDKILFKSKYAIVTPGARGFNVARDIRKDELREDLLSLAHQTCPEPNDTGIILRSACDGSEPSAIAEDLEMMWSLAAQVMKHDAITPERLLDGPNAHQRAWMEWTNPHPDSLIDRDGAFEDEGVTEMIEGLTSGTVNLGGGATMMIEPTRALVAIDVNTGGDGSPAGGLKANIATARALPRALRCRGLGGQITIDFAPSPKKDRRQVEQTLKSAFRTDPVNTVLAGWTPLGHFELQRKRQRLPLAEALA